MIRDLSGALDGQKETADYIECTVYSHDKAVIMVGDFADVKTVEDRKKVCALNYKVIKIKQIFYSFIHIFRSIVFPDGTNHGFINMLKHSLPKVKVKNLFP